MLLWASTTEILSSMPVSYWAWVQLKRLPVRLDCVVQQLLQRILAAYLKEKLRKACLFRQLLILKVGRAQLGVVLLLVNRIANFPPQIRLPRNI